MITLKTDYPITLFVMFMFVTNVSILSIMGFSFSINQQQQPLSSSPSGIATTRTSTQTQIQSASPLLSLTTQLKFPTKSTTILAYSPSSPDEAEIASSPSLLHEEQPNLHNGHNQQQEQSQDEGNQISNDGSYCNDDDDMDWFRFASINELYSSSHPKVDNVLSKLQSSTVAIIGLGGVGSWAAEALVRSGVGNFILIDLEDICISQTTSGLNSLKDNIGKFKTEIMKQRILDIHPTVHVDIINDYIMTENVDTIISDLKSKYNVDIVIDSSIDGEMEKTGVWKSCQKNNIQTITIGNPAGKIDPTKVICRQLDGEVLHYDQSLGACWNSLLEEEKEDLTTNVFCIYSEEEPIMGSSGQSNEGKVSFVSGTFGFTAASKAVNMLLVR